ncbi:hypothetical protein FHT77_000946 [Rhizobium sp. BK181]|uniref:hypothetical protein n=1 Tax=Rhizobium sp. BK181 TaxID=2587072 RepID=UPI00161C1101|nr:hypothetical protein [Rhizobium sp. BK181]MBB3315104.1 hypothetical protein [Rhizobium sp. BK181]
MRTFCFVQDGVVVNRAVFDDEGLPEEWPDRDFWIESEDAQIGWLYEDGVFSPPPSADDPPPTEQ